ncbi:sulfurtransferase-like selenium metabolism protein YedF [Enterococcus faecalis]
MEKIYALGKPCPIPVIEAKKAIQELQKTGGELTILVDNEVAVSNLEKMAAGWQLKIDHSQTIDGNYAVVIAVPQGFQLSQAQSAERSLVIAISSDEMGTGASALGKILLKSYIYSLTELTAPPTQVLFFNSGVYLTNQSSTVLEDLRTLAAKGTKISTCGACLDFYEIKETLAIGTITNMYTIAETMANCEKVIMI